jgi:microcystin-dependent protein
MFAGSTAPTGWLLCDGTAVSRTTYSDLFAITSTTYGVGDGSTTFNLPNLKGRVPVGLDTSQTEFDVLGETGGAKTHTLTST